MTPSDVIGIFILPPSCSCTVSYPGLPGYFRNTQGVEGGWLRDCCRIPVSYRNGEIHRRTGSFLIECRCSESATPSCFLLYRLPGIGHYSRKHADRATRSAGSSPTPRPLESQWTIQVVLEPHAEHCHKILGNRSEMDDACSVGSCIASRDRGSRRTFAHNAAGNIRRKRH